MKQRTQDHVERIRRFLLGLADLFELLVTTLRELAQDLTETNSNVK
jgi:hypothetical protein